MAQERSYFLDNLKWFLIILVVLHHVAITCGGSGDVSFKLPTIDSEIENNILSCYTLFQQSFFMGLFFLISAFFITPSYSKKGAQMFLIDKLKRLGIPILINVLLIEFFYQQILEYFFDRKDTFINYLGGSIIWNIDNLKKFNIDLGVTWFTYTLLIFCILFVLYKKKPHSTNTQSFPSFKNILLFALIMVPLNLFLTILFQKTSTWNFLGFQQLGFYPTYIVCFIIGIKVQQNKWFDSINLNNTTPWFLIASIITVLEFIVLIFNPLDFIWVHTYGLFVYASFVTFQTIGFSMFLIYYFKKFFNKTNPFVEELSKCAYTVFIFHNLVLWLYANLFKSVMTTSPLLNFVLLGFASVISSFVIAYFIRRLPFLNKIL